MHRGPETVEIQVLQGLYRTNSYRRTAASGSGGGHVKHGLRNDTLCLCCGAGGGVARQTVHVTRRAVFGWVTALQYCSVGQGVA